jgi:hypothetical protein
VTIIVPVEISHVNNGTLARSSRLHLAGYGRDDRRAIANLTSAVLAWGHGLTASDLLVDALARSGVQWRPEADDIAIEIVAAGSVG